MRQSKTKKIKYSVIICAHNEGEKLAASIKSIKANILNRNDIEIIIIDDHSTDNTATIAKSLKVDKFIKLPENQGISRCRNKGIKISKGKYLIFFDAHIRIDTAGSIFNLLDRIFESHPDIQGISGYYKAYARDDYNLIRDIVRKHYRSKLRKDFTISFKNFTTLSSCVLCLKREVLAKEKFPENFKGVAAEDTFLQLKLMNRHYKFLHTSRLRIIHDASLTLNGLYHKIIYQCKGTNKLLKMSAQNGFKEIPFSPFYLDFPLAVFIIAYSLPIAILFVPIKVLMLLLTGAIIFDFHKTTEIFSDKDISLNIKIKTSVYILLNEGIKLIDWPLSIFREKYNFNNLAYVIRVYYNWEKIKFKNLFLVLSNMLALQKSAKKYLEAEKCDN